LVKLNVPYYLQRSDNNAKMNERSFMTDL